MIAIVDYGVGNLYSLTCSLAHIGAQAIVTRGEGELRAAEKIILPWRGCLWGCRGKAPRAGAYGAAAGAGGAGQAFAGRVPGHAAAV